MFLVLKELIKFLNIIPTKVQFGLHVKILLYLLRWKPEENCKILAILHWPYEAAKTCKNISGRE